MEITRKSGSNFRTSFLYHSRLEFFLNFRKMVSYSLGSSKLSGLERRGRSERPIFNHGGNLDLRKTLGFGGLTPL